MSNTPIILTVSEITNAIKAQLEPVFQRIAIRGEVTNYRLQSSGHHYFSLIEGGAQLNAVMFRMSAASLAAPIKNGDTVIAEGEISVYPPRGSYQLVVRQLTPVGLGDALLKLQALKKKLLALGWFRPERKKKLPSEIRTIGVVTSLTGAVIHDIINILTRRLGAFHLVVNPVRVQGEGAALQIARAIRDFTSYSLADVVIVCRGGGSAEDLAAFNEEVVAAACVESAIPIVSAIGHETDLSITDLVADLRAPTPSAAAELISHERSERLQQLVVAATTLVRLIASRLHHTEALLHTFVRRSSQSSPQRLIEYYSLRLDEAASDSIQAVCRSLATKKLQLSQIEKALRQQAPTAKLSEQQQRLAHLERALLDTLPMRLTAHRNALSQSRHLIDEKMFRHLISSQKRFASRDWHKDVATVINSRLASVRQRLSGLTMNLQALSPQRTLTRGYAIVFRGNSHQVIRSVSMVQPQERLSIMVADGTIAAVAHQVQRNPL